MAQLHPTSTESFQDVGLQSAELRARRDGSIARLQRLPKRSCPYAAADQQLRAHWCDGWTETDQGLQPWHEDLTTRVIWIAIIGGMAAFACLASTL